MIGNSDAKKNGLNWLPLLLGLAAFLPFLAQYRYFKQLFWFGDEFPLIDEIDIQTLGHWLWYPFVENILPLFKLLWGGAVLAGSGAYIGFLWGAWTVHAVLVGLFALCLRRRGFAWRSVILCAAVYGWSASHVETLTWTVQSSSQLCTLFFVAAAMLLPVEADETLNLPRIAALFIFSTASAWSFARGLLTGPVLAAALLLPRPWKAPARNWLTAILCGLPTLVTAFLMMRHAPANSGHLTSEPRHWLAVANFALCYLGGSPLLPFWFSTAQGSAFDVAVSAVVNAGMIKLILMALGWRWASRRQRSLLLPLLLLELGYALLLGLGRSEGDWHYAMGSRYQYNSLLCTLPFFAVTLEHLFARRFLEPFRIQAAVGLVVVLGAFSFYGWSCEMPVWGEWRGLRNRHLLLGTGTVRSGNEVEALPNFPNWRAKQLVDKYHLH